MPIITKARAWRTDASFELVNDALAAFAEGHVVKPVLRFPLGSFGDLDRAKAEGAVAEAPEDVPPAPEKEPEPQPADDEKERVPAVPS